jgi:hypothetical protein
VLMKQLSIFAKRLWCGPSLIAAGFLINSPIVHATPSSRIPSASLVVQQWRAAVHHRDDTQAGVAHLTFSASEDGQAGTLDEWVTSNGEFRRSTVRQFDRNDIVLTPKRAQSRDWNNFVRELDGTELQRLRSAAFVERVMIFGPPAALRAAQLRETRDLKYWTLQFTPLGALPVTWYIDKRTSLPVKAVFAGPEDLDINTAYDEWRWASGAFYPEHVSTETDRSLSEYRLSRSLTTSSVDAAVFAPLQPGASDVVTASPVVTLPFTLEENHIILQAQVNGRPAIGFILDTGDEHETINASRMTSFGLTSYGSVHGEGGGGPAEMSSAAGATFRFPGAELRDQHVSVLDQSGLERALGIPLGGLLGYDFLSRFVIEIDYDSKTMKLHRPNGWRYAGNGASVPLTFDDDGIPYFDAVLSVPTKPNLPAHMVMDFGAAETMTLTSPFVRANDLIKLAGTNTNVASPAGLEKQFFTQNNMRGHIDELHLGSLVVRSIPVNMSANSTGAYASPNFAGTIGEGIFSRYHVFLDYARHRVIFENTARTDAPFPERKTFGLALIASGADLHTFTVSSVRPGSAAESAGFRKGDVIVGFDDRRAAQFSLGELRGWLLKEGESHLFRVSRDGEEASIDAPIVLVSIDRRNPP